MKQKPGRLALSYDIDRISMLVTHRDNQEYHQNDHGSDYKAIPAHLLMGATEHKEKRRIQMYDMADCKMIREEVTKMVASDFSQPRLSA
jgi:hypothetical protein